MYEQVYSTYTYFELCCLGKYLLIEHILRCGYDFTQAVYADNDVCFFSSVEDILKFDANHCLLLSPHHLSPSDITYEFDTLLHGSINAGLLGINFKSEKLFSVLSWLIDRISKAGFHAPSLDVRRSTMDLISCYYILL